MNINEEALDVIVKETVKAIKVSLTKAGFDRIVKGQIVTVLSNQQYEVLIRGIVHTVKSISNVISTIGDYVYVIIPENNMDNAFLLQISSSGGTSSGVSSFNTRIGAVTSQTGDYTAAQVGALKISGSVSDLNFNNNLSDGIFRCFNMTGNLPAGYTSDNDFTLLVTTVGADYITQTIWDIRSENIFLRKKMAGIWYSWQKIYHQGNKQEIITDAERTAWASVASRYGA